MNKKYYVIDDITGVPVLAEIIAIKDERVYLQSMTDPRTNYCRTLDTIYADTQQAWMHISVPNFNIHEGYGCDYTGAYEDF